MREELRDRLGVLLRLLAVAICVVVVVVAHRSVSWLNLGIMLAGLTGLLLLLAQYNRKYR